MIPVEVLRVMWAATGSLYTSNTERAMEGDIRAAVERTDGPFREDVDATRAEVMPAAAARPSSGRITLDGMTHREIADALGISPASVQQIEARALAKMRRQFEARFGNPFPATRQRVEGYVVELQKYRSPSNWLEADDAALAMAAE